MDFRTININIKYKLVTNVHVNLATLFDNLELPINAWLKGPLLVSTPMHVIVKHCNQGVYSLPVAKIMT